MRLVAVALVVATACTPATAPKARSIGKVISIAGVTGLIATALGARFLGDSAAPMMMGLSTASGVGIGIFAAGELGGGPQMIEETTTERHHRWARILTERAYGYARDGRCPRVRHIETRVRVYDREFHDFVFMRDPEIQKCLSPPPEVIVAPPAPEVPGVEAPGSTIDSP